MMRESAVRAHLVSLLIVPTVASALPAQCIERAVTEQTVKLRFINPFVAGEILAFPVLKKLMVKILVSRVHGKVSSHGIGE